MSQGCSPLATRNCPVLPGIAVRRPAAAFIYFFIYLFLAITIPSFKNAIGCFLIKNYIFCGIIAYIYVERPKEFTRVRKRSRPSLKEK
jgi:hypothetical protein